jgi:hypothetical protein
MQWNNGGARNLALLHPSNTPVPRYLSAETPALPTFFFEFES